VVPPVPAPQMKEREAAIQSLLRDMEARLALAEAAVLASDKEKAAALEKAAQAEARAEQLAKEMVEATEQAMGEVRLGQGDLPGEPSQLFPLTTESQQLKPPLSTVH